MLGVAQLIPTAGLVIAAGLLLELAGSPFGPAAGDNGSGVAIAIALARALDVSPSGPLAVEIVLQGAGDGAMTGLSRYLSARRSERWGAATTIVCSGSAAGVRWRAPTDGGPAMVR